MAIRAPDTIRAGIYARLSRDPLKTRPNILGQERRCRELIERRGWITEDLYVDRDRTASGHDPDRPAYARMCNDIRSGRINAVVALDQDRLVREPYELELLLRLCEDAGAVNIVTSEGEINAEGAAMARIRASMAANEIEKMKERHRRRQEDIAREGKWGGGYRAFGYSADHLSVDEAEAGLLRDAAHRLIAGESAEAIAREWNDAGTKTVLGKAWRGKSLRRVLTSPTIVGLREYRGEIVAVAVWPAILDRTIWESVRLASASRPEATTSSPPREYLLSRGLAICGVCGSSLRARPRADTVRSYVCVAEVRRDGALPCGGIRCVAEPLEELVVESVITGIDMGTFGDSLGAPEYREACARQVELSGLLAETQHRLTVAEELYLEGDVSRDSYLRVRDRHQKIAESVLRELAILDSRTLAGSVPSAQDELRTWWAAAQLAQKRALLCMFIKSVSVNPAAYRGARFSADRVEIEWWKKQLDSGADDKH